MTATQSEDRVREWMLEAFTHIRALHERMDSTASEVEQQQLSDESATVAQVWETSRYAGQWRELWEQDSRHQADAGLRAQRDQLVVELAEVICERDSLRAETTALSADRSELASRLARALDERDQLRHLVHELQVEVDDALDLAAPHVLDADHERLAVPMTPIRAPRQQVVMQQ